MIESYDQTYGTFRWQIPEFYNIGVDVCDRQACAGARVAIICVDDQANATRQISFDELRRMSNRLASTLKANGLVSGDRVAVLLPPSIETAVAHIATSKAGLISVPLPPSLGEEALEYRLCKSGSRILITDLAGSAKIQRIRSQLPALVRTYTTGGASGSPECELAVALDLASERFEAVATRANDPAILVFTSGTEGTPKGVLHAHRSLLGCLPVFELVHNSLPAAGELFWTPADWGWIAGLFPILGALHYGMSVLACSAPRFDPQRALAMMVAHGVKSAFIPPTALKLMRLANAGCDGIKLRSLLSGGERLGEELLGWAETTFNVPIQEVYGQTECNGVVASNTRLFPLRPGSMGRAIPGHDVRIVDDGGGELPRGHSGMIAVRQPDPGTFLGYWEDEIATASKFAGHFLLTGDIASQDEDGYFWYIGRADDIISSSSYRIDPSEVEACIGRHAAVSMVAVVGVPDAVCTERIKAWVVLKPGWPPCEDLALSIQQFARKHLAPHQCPRNISFAEALPLSANGKIMRSELRARG